MPDYVEEIKLKDIALISLKVKIKESEVILFDDDVEEDTEFPEDANVIYENELARLRKEYGDNIPEEELEKVKKLVDAMNFYWQTQSSFSDDLVEKLQANISGIEISPNSSDEDLLEKIFKVMLFQYANLKKNIQKSEEIFKESSESLEKSRTKVRHYENLGAFDHLKLFLKILFGI